MGWTHYWKREPSLPKDLFSRASADFKRLIANCNAEIGSEDGSGVPVILHDMIEFNGINNIKCEPFCISVDEESRMGRDYVISYCKTEQLPYDKYVQCALIILKHYLIDKIQVFSDGKDNDWTEASMMCKRLFGYGENFMLDIQD